MKVFLMHPDRDFDLEAELPANRDDLENDLELPTLYDTMARGDKLLHETARRGVLLSLTDADTIRYRQHVLDDCLRNADDVRRLFALATEALANQRKLSWGWSKAPPSSTLHWSVNVLDSHLDVLRRLRMLADEASERFRSEGFSRFFGAVAGELDDEYLASVESHLKALRFKGGLLTSAQLGKGNRGQGYVVRRRRERSWSERLLAHGDRGLSFTIAERDEAGHRALEDIRSRAVNRLADATAQSAGHVTSFFRMLQAELAFYLGCLNLHDWLVEHGAPVCFPEPLGSDTAELGTSDLYDPCLAIQMRGAVVPNDVDTEGRPLVVVTGANQGGKSTLLRSIGLALLMMQSGMVVAATSFRAGICEGLFTHYKREEDDTMESGKLDEELARMSQIADAIRPRCVLLCNESFASTNEREGSEIARQVVRAMLGKRIRVVFVTHMYDLAHGFEADEDGVCFLRAERGTDGERTYKVRPGHPLSTSFGEDTYREVFGADGSSAGEIVATGRAT
jgi:MutS domain V